MPRKKSHHAKTTPTAAMREEALNDNLVESAMTTVCLSSASLLAAYSSKYLSSHVVCGFYGLLIALSVYAQCRLERIQDRFFKPRDFNGYPIEQMAAMVTLYAMGSVAAYLSGANALVDEKRMEAAIYAVTSVILINLTSTLALGMRQENEMRIEEQERFEASWNRTFNRR